MGQEGAMQRFMRQVRGVSRAAYVIAGVSLTFLMFLTIADVVLRSFRRPIVGTYELVALSGAVAIGFAVPFTSWTRGHIFVDFFIGKLPKRLRDAFNIATRCLGLGLFLMIGWNMVKYGTSLLRSGEVSLTLQLPFYPVAYGLGAACFLQCVVLFCDILKVLGGEYE